MVVGGEGLGCGIGMGWDYVGTLGKMSSPRIAIVALRLHLHVTISSTKWTYGSP